MRNMDGKITRKNLVVGDWPEAKFVSQLLFKAEGYVTEENINSMDEVHVMVNVDYEGGTSTQIRANSDNEEYDGSGELWLAWKETGVFETDEEGKDDLIIDTPDGRAVLKGENFKRQDDFVMPNGQVVKVYEYEAA